MQASGPDDPRTKRIQILLEEYKALKDEQKARIGFRDNLLYVTLAACGGVAALALSKDGPPVAPLLIPWLTFILGWTYLVNDQKISAIGLYVRGPLHSDLQTMVGTTDKLLKWETEHRDDDLHTERKLCQLFVDLITFAGSGLAALALYLWRNPNPPPAAYWVCGLEAGLLLFLIFQIFSYADWKKGA